MNKNGNTDLKSTLTRPNSEILDWDSPSTQTGTVKRRPNSSHSEFSTSSIDLKTGKNPVIINNCDGNLKSKTKSSIPQLKNEKLNSKNNNLAANMGNTKSKKSSLTKSDNCANNNLKISSGLQLRKKDSDFQVFDRGKVNNLNKSVEQSCQSVNKFKDNSPQKCKGLLDTTVLKAPKKSDGAKMFSKRTLEWVKISSKQKLNEQVLLNNEVNHTAHVVSDVDDVGREIILEKEKISNENVSPANICDSLDWIRGNKNSHQSTSKNLENHPQFSEKRHLGNKVKYSKQEQENVCFICRKKIINDCLISSATLTERYICTLCKTTQVKKNADSENTFKNHENHRFHRENSENYVYLDFQSGTIENHHRDIQIATKNRILQTNELPGYLKCQCDDNHDICQETNSKISSRHFLLATELPFQDGGKNLTNEKASNGEPLKGDRKLQTNLVMSNVEPNYKDNSLATEMPFQNGNKIQANGENPNGEPLKSTGNRFMKLEPISPRNDRKLQVNLTNRKHPFLKIKSPVKIPKEPEKFPLRSNKSQLLSPKLSGNSSNLDRKETNSSFGGIQNGAANPTNCDPILKPNKTYFLSPSVPHNSPNFDRKEPNSKLGDTQNFRVGISQNGVNGDENRCYSNDSEPGYTLSIRAKEMTPNDDGGLCRSNNSVKINGKEIRKPKIGGLNLFTIYENSQNGDVDRYPSNGCIPADNHSSWTKEMTQNGDADRCHSNASEPRRTHSFRTKDISQNGDTHSSKEQEMAKFGDVNHCHSNGSIKINGKEVPRPKIGSLPLFTISKNSRNDEDSRSNGKNSLRTEKQPSDNQNKCLKTENGDLGTPKFLDLDAPDLESGDTTDVLAFGIFPRVAKEDFSNFLLSDPFCFKTNEPNLLENDKSAPKFKTESSVFLKCCDFSMSNYDYCVFENELCELTKTISSKSGLSGSGSDSGIAESPLSPMSIYGVSRNFKLEGHEECCFGDLLACTKLKWQQKIYTDWANHYLEKGRCKKRISSLATDCSDGVLLADVIECVINQKIPDINRKPKSSSQMLENINNCLSVLRTNHVPGVESISSADLQAGRLKAVLGLFFALSRHKQATKQKQQQQQQQNNDMAPNRQGGLGKGGTNIPVPGSVIATRRCAPDKVRPVAGSSRASSPGVSMIPRGPPGSQPNAGQPQNNSIPTPASPYQQPPSNITSPIMVNGKTNTSMLEKFKNERTGITTTGKRTSSSSGVSSARSERSDSSASLIEPTSEIKQVNKVAGNKQRPSKPQLKTTAPVTSKHSPNTGKKELNAKIKPTNDMLERHANKVASISVKGERESKIKVPQVKVSIPQPVTTNGTHQEKPGVGQTAIPGTGIPKPTAAIKGTTKMPPREPDKPLPTTPIKATPPTISRESSQIGLHTPTKQAVAMVSPMPSQPQTVSNDLLADSTNSTSTTGQQSINSSESSSVIYKPNGEIGTEQNTEIKSPKKENYEEENLKEFNMENSKKTEPIKEDILQKPITNHIREGSQDDETTPMNVQPMRPLLRGYCSNLTLPTLPTRGTVPQVRYPSRLGIPEPGMVNGAQPDYCEISIASGYMSDGEVLRNGPTKQPADNYDGYMSEGGNLYGRKIQNLGSQLPNGCGRIGQGLTVLAEQSTRRGRVDETTPPNQHRPNSRTRTNGHSQESNKHGQWKRYTDSPGVGSPNGPPPPPAPGSPTSSRRERRSSPHSASKEQKSSSKVRGVPQSFGYVKRNSSSTNGSVSPSPGAPNGTSNNKTAQVSAVPRTKVKVSGGTQTCSSDLQPHKTNSQFKSYSLTGNAASQLSQSVRERLMMGSQSLPKAAGQEYSLLLRQARAKASDGSLSDTQAADPGSPYAPWLRHSNTYSVAPRLTETDSMESLSSLPGHRGSLTHQRLMRESPSRLSRSNSIRSTKSEKLYPSMLHRNAEQDSEPYYCLPVGAVLNHWSQPTSPAPGNSRQFPLSPTHSTPRHSIPKNDDIHGSSISLVSTASSLYSSAEEKQAHEIRKLRRELMDAQEKVQTLTSQLSTNAHVVSAFEQSLSSMTQRLQHLTATAERKDSELAELRAAMDALRASSVQAGLTSGLARQPSSDSVSSLSSACSLDKQDKNKKKKGWLRSSFTKAFSRNAKITTTKVQSQSETESERERAPSPPPVSTISTATATDGIPNSEQQVVELQKQLREKDLVLTDIRLEALSSAHQLESLKDTVMKMRNEMLSLKQNNERLQRMVGCGVTNVDLDRGVEAIPDIISTEDIGHIGMNNTDGPEDGKKITISIFCGQPHLFEKYYNEHYSGDCDVTTATSEVAIAHTSIGASTNWPQLDNIVRRSFKQHVARLDPGGGLGLGGDSVASYRLGEAERGPDLLSPDLLPVGYVVGRVKTLHIILQPVAALAFEALIPRGVAQRLVSLLSEHRRLVLCGTPGTGKSYLATRLAEFYAQSQGRDPAEAVATFNVDNKSGKELRQYLQHLSEQAAAGDSSVLPCVVVLDNLHRAGPLAEALGSLPRNLPCLIGTMAQAACSATSLQLQHGFRWVLVAPHMEPARGLLGRVLRRKLATLELEQGPQPELAAVLGWLPRVWQHLNTFLETHSSGDVAIGPRLFLSCPLDLESAKAWFSDVWNYSLAPYLREAAREGLQLYGRRATWTDPTQFIFDTYPWSGMPPQLTRIAARDVGLGNEPQVQVENEGDPLLSMLMRLQEAANYSSPHSNDSDCASMDSNLTHESSLGTESVL